MPLHLTIKQDETVLLDEHPPKRLAGSFQRFQLDTLDDFVQCGVIKSHETIQSLLAAAQGSTLSALTSRETFVPFIPIHGTARPDLRRFGGFAAAVPEIDPVEVRSFWRVVRAIDPRILTTVTPKTSLELSGVTLPAISLYLLGDIAVEEGAVLEVAPAVQILDCRHLVIKRTGRLIVQAGNLIIKAFSVQGEQ